MFLCLFFCADQQVASSAETVKRTSTCGNHKRVGPRGKSTSGLSVPTASRWRTCSGRPPRPRYATQGQPSRASESRQNGQNLQRHLVHYYLPLLPKLCSSHLPSIRHAYLACLFGLLSTTLQSLRSSAAVHRLAGALQVLRAKEQAGG